MKPTIKTHYERPVYTGENYKDIPSLTQPGMAFSVAESLQRQLQGLSTPGKIMRYDPDGSLKIKDWTDLDVFKAKLARIEAYKAAVSEAKRIKDENDLFEAKLAERLKKLHEDEKVKRELNAKNNQDE